MQNFFDWCLAHWGFTLFCVTCVIQVTPIFKVNPITALFKWISNIMNKDLRDSIAVIQAELVEQREEIRSNEKDRIRAEVLDFANSCHNGGKHKKSEYEHIIAINDKYEYLLKITNDTKNGVFTAEYDFVLNQYKEHLRNNDFF